MNKVLLSLVALGSAAVVTFSGIDLIKAVRALSWPTTEGSIFSSRLIARGELHGRFISSVPVYTYEETIEYKANGHTYFKTMQTVSAHESLLISYNPKKPTEIWIGPKGPNVFETFLLVAAASILGIIGVRKLNGPERKKTGRKDA